METIDLLKGTYLQKFYKKTVYLFLVIALSNLQDGHRCHDIAESDELLPDVLEPGMRQHSRNHHLHFLFRRDREGEKGYLLLSKETLH